MHRRPPSTPDLFAPPTPAAGCVARVVIPATVDQPFDYAVPDSLATALAPGCAVEVPFRRRTVVGYVAEVGVKSTVPPGRLRAITALAAAERSVIPAVFALCRWAAAYYHAPLGDFLKAAQPPAAAREGEATRAWVEAVAGGGELLTPRRRAVWEALAGAGPLPVAEAVERLSTTRTTLRAMAAAGALRLTHRPPEEGPPAPAPAGGATAVRPTLTAEQEQCLTDLRAALGDPLARPVLLHGVTGSGKTEVYLRLAEGVVAAGGQVLVLVPEIGLTPQVAAAFAERFAGQVVIQHSGLAAGARRAQWRAIAVGARPVVVGTRSALFAPLARLRLLVVDEEHDPSYKQEEQPRYHGRDLAIVRAHQAGALVVLGSATPALETLHHAHAGQYRRLVLRERATGQPLPPVTLVDMRRALVQGLFSERLLTAIRQRLARGEQSLIFLNRRGYARAVQCTACGAAIGCPHCSTTLTYHRVDGMGRCHLCGYHVTPSLACPGCGKVALQLAGVGTQKVEERLHHLFPAARVVRMDRDTTARAGAHGRLLARMHAGEADILLGTQIVTKGHHLGRVTLVGVLLADLALQLPDFRAAERCFQLLVQVAGRCGREGPGEVILQTFQPESPVLAAVAAYDYDGFAARELTSRKSFGLPPFGHLVLLVAEAVEEGAVRGYLEQVAGWWRDQHGVRTLGPTPAMVARVADRYRYHLLLSGPRSPLHAALRRFLDHPTAHPPRTVRLKIDVDPQAVA